MKNYELKRKDLLIFYKKETFSEKELIKHFIGETKLSKEWALKQIEKVLELGYFAEKKNSNQKEDVTD